MKWTQARSGVYELIYTVNDKAGNEAAGQRRTVEVKSDGVPPVIQLIGRANIYVVEAGVTVCGCGSHGGGSTRWGCVESW